MYAQLAEAVIKNLPDGGVVVGLVDQGIREHWLGQDKNLGSICLGLLGVEAVQTAVRKWWDFLLGLLRKNSEKPPTSPRMVEYEKARRLARLKSQHLFSHDDTIRAKAMELGVDTRRVTHTLISVFGAIDQVSQSARVW